jgi:hypothetical protein
VSGRIWNAANACLSIAPRFSAACMEMLEKFDDVAMNSRKYDEAAEHFSTILSLNPVDCAEILIKRSDALRSSLPDLSLVMKLHKWFNALPSPSLSSCRLQLPGIVFRLAELDHTSGPDPVMNLVYHATASALGDIKTKTVDDLTWRSDLYLVHSWIRPLLDQEVVRLHWTRLHKRFGSLLVSRFRV